MAFRRLTEAEIAIWRQVARTVAPRPDSVLPELAAPPSDAAPAPSPEAPTARSYHAASYTPPVSAPKSPPAGLERRYRRRVARGHISVEAVLDLHGLTQAEAHAALHRFLARAQHDGLRLVMVVTGKGGRARRQRQDAAEPGVLRRSVPFWLGHPTLRAAVIGFEEAALGHGGAGALYVRLRRPPGHA